MALDVIFERSTHHSPVLVVARLLMPSVLSVKWLESLSEQRRQCTSEFRLATSTL
ncbi:hypothetical protein LZ198_39810 [Myxococcus sp. K15C18031901]|uniref:hypothetical protein n=1 Tax=Myxococcus dinghuensis TaxID=2906761 RepID=UPI0020A7AEA1|nr:hypothetical protein [Myxococcus dinghuensis]MCP3105031.1 hypothetical protein [Myxococcus dinghuensis]